MTRPPLPPIPRGVRFDAATTGARTGDRASRLRGTGVESEGVRRWADGDPARAIDWRATARMGEPWVRIRHDDRELPIRVVLHRSAEMDATQRTTAERAAEWLLRAAVSADHPIGLTLLDAGSTTAVRVGRGRRALAAAVRLLEGASARGRSTLVTSAPRAPDADAASAGTAAPIDSRSAEPGAPPSPASGVAEVVAGVEDAALVFVIGSFDLGPAALGALTDAVRSCPAEIVPVRIDSRWAELPKAGLVRAAFGALARTLWIDTASAAIRRRWSRGRERWLDGLRGLEAHTRPLVHLPFDSDDLAPLVDSLRGRARPRTRGRAVRGGSRVGRRGGRGGRPRDRSSTTGAPRRSDSGGNRAVPAAVVLLAGLWTAPVAGQSTPEILVDHLPVRVELGAPLVRSLEVRWAGGPAPAGASVEGEIADVHVVGVEPVGDSAGHLWRIEVRYVAWALDEQVLPTVELEGVRPGEALLLRGRRVRVFPPTAPATGLGPTHPERPAPGLPLHRARGLPLLLVGIGVVGWWIGGRRRREVVPVAPLPRGPLPGGPLDPAVGRVRRRLETLSGARPGWTARSWRRWAPAHLSAPAARTLEEFRVRADERRFHPAPPGPEEIAGVERLADRFLRETGGGE